jgi:arginine deiminase
MKLGVHSEVGQLKKVIVHRPELSIQRLTPTNCEGLLFDDVVHFEKAAREHDVFVQEMTKIGVQVHLLRDLLSETLLNSDAKSWILNRQISIYRYGASLANEIRGFLESLKEEALASYLLGGLALDELPSDTASPVRDILPDTEFLIDPLPNHLFTRDTSCWIYSGVSINPMAKQPRRRERIHFGAIYKFHPMFSTYRPLIYFGDTDSDFERDFEWTSVEGGDVLILGNKTVLMGISERTSPQGIEILAKKLFDTNQADRVIVVLLPKERSCMHLDTILTQVDQNCFTYYKRIIDRPDLKIWELRPGNLGRVDTTPIRDSFRKHIARVLDTRIEWIETGGDMYEIEREQWNDAHNLLAVKPRVVVAYEHNEKTLKNLKDRGVEIIEIPGEHLGRGRGGPRCMSCPIEREGI